MTPISGKGQFFTGHVACPKEAIKITCIYYHPYSGLHLKSDKQNEEIVKMNKNARPDHMLSARDRL